MLDQAIQGRVYLLGDDVNTDLNCSGKYLPGKDEAFIATQAFEAVSPGFATRFVAGSVIVAGKHFGINSSREQAVHILRRMGVAAIVAPSFGRQFFRNAINNGLPWWSAMCLAFKKVTALKWTWQAKKCQCPRAS
jgi:3-isopropylmalate dehydratase small subunit